MNECPTRACRLQNDARGRTKVKLSEKLRARPLLLTDLNTVHHPVSEDRHDLDIR